MHINAASIYSNPKISIERYKTRFLRCRYLARKILMISYMAGATLLP